MRRHVMTRDVEPHLSGTFWIWNCLSNSVGHKESAKMCARTATVAVDSCFDTRLFLAVCFRCSVRTDCQDAAKDALYWINYKSDRCTTIESVSPHQLQATTARTVRRLQSTPRHAGSTYRLQGFGPNSRLTLTAAV